MEENTSGAVFADGILTLNSSTASGSMTICATTENGVSVCVEIAVVGSVGLVVESNSITSTSAALTLTNKTGITVTLQAIAVVYDSNGKMVSVNMVEKTMDANGNAALSLVYSEDEADTAIQVFVLNPNTSEPLMAAWENP